MITKDKIFILKIFILTSNKIIVVSYLRNILKTVLNISMGYILFSGIFLRASFMFDYEEIYF